MLSMVNFTFLKNSSSRSCLWVMKYDVIFIPPKSVSSARSMILYVDTPHWRYFRMMSRALFATVELLPRVESKIARWIVLNLKGMISPDSFTTLYMLFIRHSLFPRMRVTSLDPEVHFLTNRSRSAMVSVNIGYRVRKVSSLYVGYRPYSLWKLRSISRVFMGGRYPISWYGVLIIAVKNIPFLSSPAR